MTAGRYWTFTTVFWLLAAALLFLNALQMDHWRQVSFRFFYIPVLGILLCAAQTLVFQAEGFRKLRYPQPWVVLMALVAAMLTALTLNLLTYLLLNLDPAIHQREILHNGATTLLILYLFWSFLWFQLEGRPLLGPKPSPKAPFIDRMTLEHLGKPVVVPLNEVDYFAASGDYVEIRLPDQSYLKKGTISALEDLLDPEQFQRVHRSTIVNVHRVVKTTALGSGAFELTFASGRTVSSSRSYLPVVRKIQP
jgi:DNA-binding LytR/AlgR family response regulator